MYNKCFYILVLITILISCKTNTPIEISFEKDEKENNHTYIKVIDLATKEFLILLVDTGCYKNLIYETSNRNTKKLDFKIKGNETVFKEEFEVRNEKTDIDGILGLNFLEKFGKVTFDFKENKLILFSELKQDCSKYKYGTMSYMDEISKKRIKDAGYQITFPVSYNSDKYFYFMFDTGFQTNCRTIALKNKRLFGFENTKEWILLDNIYIYNCSFENVYIMPMYISDLSKEIIDILPDNTGILSPNIFENHIIQLDFRAKEVCIE
jgi:hypothetical protein